MSVRSLRLIPPPPQVTAGIGAAIASATAARKATVTVVGRSQRGASAPGVTFVRGDFSLSMAESRRIAAALPLESVDVLIFTTGIVPGKTRKATPEGVELDMAVSALSRHVFLAAAAPRLKPTARVFVWGFPGSKGYMVKTALADFNSEAHYAGALLKPR